LLFRNELLPYAHPLSVHFAALDCGTQYTVGLAEVAAVVEAAFPKALPPFRHRIRNLRQGQVGKAELLKTGRIDDP
jgi:hypothetical protein